MQQQNKVFVNAYNSEVQKNKNHYIAQHTSSTMENNYRQQQKSAYEIFRIIKDIVMSLLFIFMAVVMFFPLQFKLENIAGLDNFFRYIFGGICIVYGLFRFYRGVKKDF